MRPIWKGHLTFGLVTIPVKLYTATEGKDVRFRLLHSSCMTPIQNKRYCPQHEQIVDWNDVVRGYEYAKGKFVPVSDEELDGVPLDTAGTVNVTSFADLHEIDPIYYEKSYYLAPDEGGPPLVRREVVGLLVVDWIDLVQVGERGDVDGPRRVQRHAVQFLVADGNELALRILVTADHVVPIHNLLVLRAVAFVLDRGHAAAVQEPEPYILPFRGGVELHRDRDQSKREVSLPDWTHRAVPPRRCQHSRIDVRVLYSPLYCLPIWYRLHQARAPGRGGSPGNGAKFNRLRNGPCRQSSKHSSATGR